MSSTWVLTRMEVGSIIKGCELWNNFKIKLKLLWKQFRYAIWSFLLILRWHFNDNLNHINSSNNDRSLDCEIEGADWTSSGHDQVAIIIYTKGQDTTLRCSTKMWYRVRILIYCVVVQNLAPAYENMTSSPRLISRYFQTSPVTTTQLISHHSHSAPSGHGLDEYRYFVTFWIY